MAARAHLSVDEIAAYIDPTTTIRGELGDHVDECETCRLAVSASIRAARATGQPVQHDDNHPGERVDRYAVFDVLGVGGMGAVYRAFDPRLDRKIALKILRPALCDEHNRERMQREAKMLARIAHPNVIAVYDAGTWHDRVYIAMEFVEGATLRDWLAEHRSIDEIVDVLLQAADGLACAHRAGLVHRDFKPHNVLVGRDGRARVGDFGLAELGGVSETAAPRISSLEMTTLTATGAVLGTPRYMSPEQVSGKAIDAKSDQFSFCVTAYEALYGEPPFPASTFPELRARLTSGQLPEPPRRANVPRWLSRVVLRGLAVDPEQRFSSMAELAKTLRRDRSYKQRVALAAGAAAVVAATAWYVTADRNPSAAESCYDGSVAAASTMLDPLRRQALHAALGTKLVAYAPDTERRTVAALDAYVARWRAAHETACKATHVYRNQSTQLLDIRMACLDERRRHVITLVDRLLTIDVGALGAVPQAVGALPGLDYCANVQELGEQEPLPQEGERRKLYEALRDEMSAINVERDLGDIAGALARTRALAPKLEEYGSKSLSAKFLYIEGELLELTGALEKARDVLEASAALAEASRDQDTKIVAFVRLYMIAATQRDSAATARWSRLAQAALDASTSREPVVRVSFLQAQAFDAYGKDDIATAVTKLEQALVVAKTDPESRMTASILAALGGLYREQQRHADAKRLLDESLALATTLYGPKHLEVGVAVYNLATLEDETGDAKLALEHFRRALQIYEGAVGNAHPFTGSANVQIARLLGRAPETESRAEAYFARGVAILEAAYPKGHPDLTEALIRYANFRSRQNDHRGSLALFERALALDEAALGKDDPQLAATVHGVGTQELALGNLPRALSLLRRSLALYAKQSSPWPDSVSDVETDLAHAIVASGGKRNEAIALLESALARLRKVPEADASQIKDIEDYLAQLTAGR